MKAHHGRGYFTFFHSMAFIISFNGQELLGVLLVPNNAFDKQSITHSFLGGQKLRFLFLNMTRQIAN